MPGICGTRDWFVFLTSSCETRYWLVMSCRLDISVNKAQTHLLQSLTSWHSLVVRNQAFVQQDTIVGMCTCMYVCISCGMPARAENIFCWYVSGQDLCAHAVMCTCIYVYLIACLPELKIFLIILFAGLELLCLSRAQQVSTKWHYQCYITMRDLHRWYSPTNII